MPQRYTTVRVTLETRALLEKLLVALEARLGRRLDLDDAIRMVVEDALRRIEKRPELLKALFEEPIENHDTMRALSLLREERRRDDRLV